jgi:pheromone shutdown protein TraB
MSETQSQHLDANVVQNSALHYLYILGGLALGIAAIVALIAVFTVGGGIDTTALMTWLVIAGGLANLGVLALIGGGVAHAINWQIINR